MTARHSFVVVLLFTSCVGHVAAVSAGDRPNILFVFSDDHGTQAISCYGSVLNQTPNIDRIAREGMLFRNCLVTNAICGPSRAVIQTGKYSHLNGFLHNGNRFNGQQQTFPKLMQAAGYATAVIGKWHLKSLPEGYDHYEVLIGQGPYYNPPMIRNGEKVQHEGYTTEVTTDLALEWLDQQRDPSKPFMLMFQHKAPHRNWQPGPKQLSHYDDVTLPEPATLFDDYAGRGTAAREQQMTVARHLSENDLKLRPPRNLTDAQRARWDAAYTAKNDAFRAAELTGDDLVRWKYQRYAKDYLRCVDSLDENLGRVLAYLDEHGLAEDTVVIYSSDQGWFLGEHGWYDKRWMYEESLRMPLVVRWPGAVAAGSVRQDMVSNLDFAETFLELAGVPVPSDMQGQSLVPLLKGQAPDDWRKSFYYQYYEFPGAHSVRRHYGVRTATHKLICFYGLGEWELYDLVSDPDELTNQYANPAYAAVRDELHRELQRLRAHYQVPEDVEPSQRSN